MKTDWLGFFRTITVHIPGYRARVDIRLLSAFDDEHINEMSRRLYMLPLPPGHERGRSDLACQFIAENAP